MKATCPILAVATALALSACASTAPVAAPLVAGQHQDARLVVETRSSGFEPPEWQPGADDASLPTISVHTRLLAVDPRLLEQVLGERASGLVSLVADRAQVSAALDELSGSGKLAAENELQNVTLTLRDGERGSVTVTRQEAYVSSFELVVSAENAIADPRVEVINDGLLLNVRATTDPEDGSIAVDLELSLTELEHPLAQREVRLIAGAPMTIQTPECLLRELKTGAGLGADEVLVIGGASLPVDGDRVLLAFVTAAAAAP